MTKVVELKVGMKIKCNRLSVNIHPIYEIVEVTNNPLYNLPNVTIIDRNGNRILVTDFDIV
jgi:hypothetical protein